MKEISWIELNDKIIQFNIGEDFNVRWDLFKLWENHKDNLSKPYKFSFVHTHPFEHKPFLSSKDFNAIKTINAFLGHKRFYFLIVGEKKTLVSTDVNSYYIDTPFDYKPLIEISQCL